MSEIEELLSRTRSHIAEGNGKDALETLIRAIIANTGESSVIPILQEMNAKMEKERKKQIYAQIQEICHNLIHEESLLQEMGDESILVEAFQDGSSVVCQRCKGLISLDRAEKHAKYWCPMAENVELDEEDEGNDEDSNKTV